MPSPERCWIRTTQSGGAQDDETVTVGMKVVGVIYRSNPEVSASSTVACGEYAHLVQRVQETITSVASRSLGSFHSRVDPTSASA